MTTIQPLDSRHAETYNRFADGDDQVLAQRFDAALRLLIQITGDRKILAIKMLRDFAISFGATMGLLEAKTTIDVLRERMIIETLRDMLAVQVDSAMYVDLNARLDVLDPAINRAKAALAQAQQEDDEYRPE